MFQLVYSSLATGKVDQDVLSDILDTSRENNAEKGITGLLLYKGGRFMQVLEGPKEAVLETYEVIKQDDRHKNIYTLYQGEAPRRDFEAWEMGYKDVDAVSLVKHEGVSTFFEQDTAADLLVGHASAVKSFLHLFKGMR